MSDDLQTNTLKFGIEYKTFNKLNIITDSYNEVLALGIKNINNALNNNIITRIKIFCNDNGINYLVSDEQKTTVKRTKKIHVRLAYKKERFKVPQKMSSLHTDTVHSSLTFLDEELYVSSLYDHKNVLQVSHIKLAMFLSKKYAHNPYSYAGYFFNKLETSSLRFNKMRHINSFQFKEFSIKLVDMFTASILADKVLKYTDLHKTMHVSRIKHMQEKHKLNKVVSYQNYKKFDNLIKEYQRMLEDTVYKVSKYNGVNPEYQQALKESLMYLKADAFSNRETAKLDMLSDKRYIKQIDKVNTSKDAYTKALKEVVNYRRNFSEYLIFQKVAGWKYKDSKGNYAINGVNWSVKTPVGKLMDRNTLSSLQKGYTKVTFDRKALKLQSSIGK